MGQEFFIKSADLESKVRKLLPSQGGSGAGFDLSASTQIIPIIDLTESAEGSNIRADLQTAYGFNSTFNNLTNSTATIISNTGYYRLLGQYRSTGTTGTTGIIAITDGATTNNIRVFASSVSGTVLPFDFNIFLSAGDSCTVTAGTNSNITVTSRQIATIDGTLVDP